ncbi:molybdopterin-guanine dinucleotide biosynthesis protein B [Jannaschia aquimarina]|uniref:MobB protein n=1 Tax=Jannaschia aquimarina TaxID=935700 RepID=A0A0D1EI30_9RHOB|nr:molybdopterin-guanine dinucleotide biosynthesis protein B [Jannaschia aquimarina]KIT15505.1 Molybdopterin-guanine dinucleotide biosynthesis adapter protein [Jannaschia aquimarina]SNT34256.1 molybdopterin guanine dinucleotide biosynthesis accessory protein MobB [Jannaschia aquimarina]
MILWGIVGRKNAGKTTLTERLVAELTGRGLVVSTLKRTHHALDLDVPGTDSHRHREAGARQVLLASDARVTLMEEVRQPTLTDLLGRLAPCDVVLAEGWKHGSHPRIEVWREACGASPLAADDPTIAAIACDTDPGTEHPRLDVDDIAGIADWISR